MCEELNNVITETKSVLQLNENNVLQKCIRATGGIRLKSRGAIASQLKHRTTTGDSHFVDGAVVLIMPQRVLG